MLCLNQWGRLEVWSLEVGSQALPVAEQSKGLGPLLSCCHCLDGTKLASYIEAAAHVQHVLNFM